MMTAVMIPVMVVEGSAWEGMTAAVTVGVVWGRETATGTLTASLG